MTSFRFARSPSIDRGLERCPSREAGDRFRLPRSCKLWRGLSAEGREGLDKLDGRSGFDGLDVREGGLDGRLDGRLDGLESEDGERDGLLGRLIFPRVRVLVLLGTERWLAR
ncbi:MAG: hypothetical protein AB4050_01305 [Synechococcus sp.]